MWRPERAVLAVATPTPQPRLTAPLRPHACLSVPTPFATSRLLVARIHRTTPLGAFICASDVAESDVWLADMNYRVAVTQQARVWKGVSAKLGDLFGRMKDIEVERRMVRYDTTRYDTIRYDTVLLKFICY